MSEQGLRAGLAEAARRVAAEGLVVGTGGNLSVRDGEDLLVTASGVDLARCRPEDVVRVRPDGRREKGEEGEPTSEIALHQGLYADSAATGAVVHVHAPWSTAIACVLDELPVVHYQQLLLGGTIRVAPYATFGTPALAVHVRTAMTDRSVALMANHGAVAVGSSLEQAVERALLLEWLCALHHRASALGAPRVLTEEQQTEVVLAALSRNYGGASA